MRTNHSLRKISGLTQQEKAIWLGVSRSEINMTERGQRSLPTQAHLKLCRLEIARHQLHATKQSPEVAATLDVSACSTLMTEHLEVCKRKLYKMEPKLAQLEARHKRLKSRQLTLELMRTCTEPDCTEAAQKWLEHAIFLNEQQLGRLQYGQLFVMQHRMNMLLAEIAATEQVLKDVGAGNTGDTQPGR